jgi:hypothetical protein
LHVPWFRTPDGRKGVDGAIARITIDLPPGISEEQVTLTVGTAMPPPSHPLALITSVGEGGDPGTVSASVQFPQITGVDWVVSAVPEPATVALLALGALVVLARR